MAQAKTPRTAWVDGALHALAEDGPDGIRVDVIARSLGVTRGGFYGYFANRAALVAEALDHWEHQMSDAIIDAVEAQGGNAVERLRRLHDVVESRVEARSGPLVETAIREWASRDEAVAERLQRVDRTRMEYLVGLFGEFCEPGDAEARAATVVAVWVAGSFATFGHGHRTHAQVVDAVLADVLDPSDAISP